MGYGVKSRRKWLSLKDDGSETILAEWRGRYILLPSNAHCPRACPQGPPLLIESLHWKPSSQALLSGSPG